MRRFYWDRPVNNERISNNITGLEVANRHLFHTTYKTQFILVEDAVWTLLIM